MNRPDKSHHIKPALCSPKFLSITFRFQLVLGKMPLNTFNNLPLLSSRILTHSKQSVNSFVTKDDLYGNFSSYCSVNNLVLQIRVKIPLNVVKASTSKLVQMKLIT